ncbi:hypothetical protein KAS08_06060, partial [Candidatus Pacearchaeota archaeon]|nr:hypothetical protein [Candidatus Pacearchaeota archaeon]
MKSKKKAKQKILMGFFLAGMLFFLFGFQSVTGVAEDSTPSEDVTNPTFWQALRSFFADLFERLTPTGRVISNESVEEEVSEEIIDSEPEAQTPDQEPETQDQEQPIATEVVVDANETESKVDEEVIQELNETQTQEEEINQTQINETAVIPIDNVTKVVNETQDESIAPEYNETQFVNETQQIETVPTEEEPILENITEIPEENVTIPENITEIINETKINETIQDVTLEDIVEVSRAKIIINKPVKWIKKINTSGINLTTNLIIEIPEKSSNVSILIGEEVTEAINEIEAYNEIIEESTSEEFSTGIITGQVSLDVSAREGVLTRFWSQLTDMALVAQNWLTNFRITGQVILEKDIKEKIKKVDDKKSVDLTQIIEQNPDDIIAVEYYTEGPTSVETDIPNGKRVIVSAGDELNYSDVFSFVEISNKISLDNKERIRVKWVEQNSYVDFNVTDTNNDGLIDYVEWNVPYLSTQTFEIIYITKAEHLDENKTFVKDIYNEVKELDGVWSEVIEDGEYVRVTFEKKLDNTKDITIYPRVVSGNPRIEVYEVNGSEIIVEFTSINNNQYNKVFLTNLQGVQDTFDLKVVGGSVELDHIVDPPQVLIEDKLYDGDDEYAPGSRVVFLNDTHGYVFYQLDRIASVSYKKTTDGGATWGTNVDMTGGIQKTFRSMSVWYEPWTVGDSGTKIHIASNSYDTDIVEYCYLDTINDSVCSSWVVAFGGGGSHNAPNMATQIVKSTDNNLFFSAADSTGGHFMGKSVDGGASWGTDMSPNYAWMNDGDDHSQLFPLANGDILLIYHDTSVGAMYSLRYNETTDTWDTDGNQKTIITGTGSVDYICPWGATYDKDSHDIYLSVNNQINTATADLVFYEYTASTNSWSSGVDIFTDIGVGNTDVKLAIDENNKDLYAVYSNGTTFKNPQGIYTKNSTDGGATWGAATKLSETADAQLWHVGINFMNNEYLYSIWIHQNQNDMFGKTLADLDSIYPQFSSFSETPSDTVTYSLGATYGFNSTIILTNGTSWVNFNNQNYSASNIAGNVFGWEPTDLAAGAYNYNWGAYGSGPKNNINTSGIYSYTINKANSLVNLTLNDSESNITIFRLSSTNLTCSQISGDSSSASLRLYKNGTLINQGISPISNLTTFTTEGLENITCIYETTQNYTTTSKTFWVNITQPNRAPNFSTPTINSTSGLNSAADNLNCFDSIFDEDEDDMNITVRWYKDDNLVQTLIYNNNYPNGTFFNSVLLSTNTSEGEFWKCGITLYDGEDYSIEGNSSSLLIASTMPSLVNSLVVFEGDGGWGEAWNFSVDLSDASTEDVEVGLYFSTNNETWNLQNQTNVTCPCGGIEVEFVRSWSEAYIGTSYFQFRANDYSTGETNITTEVSVLKDDINVSLLTGDGSNVSRISGSTLLEVFMTDLDKGGVVEDEISCGIWVTTDGVNYAPILSEIISGGTCSYNFDPDNSYDVGIQDWVGGLEVNSMYNEENSSVGVLNIIGSLNSALDLPSGVEKYRANENADFRWNVTGDAGESISSIDSGSVEVISSGGIATEACNFGQINNEGAGWYNCTWAIPFDLTLGLYDVRINSSEQFYYNKSDSYLEEFEVLTAVPVLNGISSLFEDDGGWGENWNFSINVTDPNPEDVNVSLYFSTDNSSWVLQNNTNVSCPCASTEVKFVRDSGWNETYIGTSYVLFTADDYNLGEDNTTAEVNVLKDDVSFAFISGEGVNVNRNGIIMTLLEVSINDSDRGQEISTNENCAFWVTTNGASYGGILSNVSSTNICSYNFDPDNSYDAGVQNWIGGLTSSAIYNAVNSSSSTLTVIGDLILSLEIPNGTQNYQSQEIIDFRWNV